ncbi:uncharacterized protein GIQ15_03759 [Arthroderma uncinatum]|uniref:uncharacterized protein n=1 Tax=Arthroderma uncinatum TaxID=74035 RepID=UPI00144ABA6C|nr:uncharacterized protein GIQ15_03759 [Arthroderma uncinatum]KAF3484435.1 hypothetical protein GIQ15_03759 [Arthroderma uncinatum]
MGNDPEKLSSEELAEPPFDGLRRKDWVMLCVTLPFMLHNTYLMFQAWQKFESWGAASTTDKTHLIWGAISMVFAITTVSGYGTLLVLSYRDRA